MKNLFKYTLFLAVFSIFPFLSFSQNNVVNVPHIRTLQVKANDNWIAPPIIYLGTNDFVEISFDELTHEYHRYTYQIQHCNADWTVDDLFETDYLAGFNNNVIDDFQNSLNTTMLYTHYRFRLPNPQAQLLISGNYLVSVYGEDDNETPVLQACFSVVSPQVGISANVTGNTDIDTNNSHQQVSFNVNYGGMNVVSPQAEFKARVYQNRRADNCVSDIEPSYLLPNQLQYVHNRKLIFDAGNEYRRFEIVNVNDVSPGVEQIRFFDPYYHAVLLPDYPRINYSYDQDQDGLYYIRYDMAQDNDTEADYLFVHFTLNYEEPLPNGEFYLNGEFTYDRFSNDFAMTYNEKDQAYESVQLLKQGSYNWLYLFVPEGSTQGETAQAAGNFYETENEYLIYIYHKGMGDRYDKLVGIKSIRYTQDL